MPVISSVVFGYFGTHSALQRGFDKAIEISQEPRDRRLELYRENDELMARAEAPPLVGSSFGGVSHMLWQLDVRPCYVGGCRLVLALERFLDANNRFPESLAELAPEFIDSVPSDPMAADGAYRYQRDDDGSGYRLYSVGADGVDDSGAERTSDTMRVLTQMNESGYDFVFRPIE